MTDSKKVYINAYFTKEHINGVPRYAAEIIKRMDKYFKKSEAEFVIPKGAELVTLGKERVSWLTSAWSVPFGAMISFIYMTVSRNILGIIILPAGTLRS